MPPGVRSHYNSSYAYLFAPSLDPSGMKYTTLGTTGLDVSLTESDIEHLETPYEPVRVSGHG
jgi:hypothetical protein